MLTGCKLRDFILKSQFYGQAKNLVNNNNKEDFNSDFGSDHILSVIHKHHPLSFVTDVYSDFYSLLSTRLISNKKVRNYESRFETQLSCSNTHHVISMQDPLLALVLLTNAAIKDNQRISILDVSLSSVMTIETTHPDAVNLLEKVNYAPNDSVLRQCYKTKARIFNEESNSLNANNAFRSSCLLS